MLKAPSTVAASLEPSRGEPTNSAWLGATPHLHGRPLANSPAEKSHVSDGRSMDLLWLIHGDSATAFLYQFAHNNWLRLRARSYPQLIHTALCWPLPSAFWSSTTYLTMFPWACGLSGCCFYRALGSHPFFPSRAASSRCVLAATAARVPTGVVSALAEPMWWSSWHNGVELVVAGVVLRFLPPTTLRTQVVHNMPRRVPVCVRPNAEPLCVFSWSYTTRLPTLLRVWGPSAPSLRMAQVGIARTCMVATGGVRSFVVDAGSVCTCVMTWMVCTAPLLHHCPRFCPPRCCPRFLILSSTIVTTGRLTLQGSPRWPSGLGMPCAQNNRLSGADVRLRSPGSGPLGAGSWAQTPLCRAPRSDTWYDIGVASC